jgi:hypothetical protein
MKSLCLGILLSVYSTELLASTVELWNKPDWTKDVQVTHDRANIYEVSEEMQKTFDREGRLHALWYPVEVTGLKIPLRPLDLLSNPNQNIFKTLLLKLADRTINLSSPDDLYDFMGLKTYPTEEGSGSYFVPFKDGTRPDVRMGITIGDNNSTKYLTASCAACHSESLFGKPIIGLTNKTPRANETFYLASFIVPKISAGVLRRTTAATTDELDMWREGQEVFKWIGVKKPQILGLDTSLATVSLSLSKRESDPYATISPEAYLNPRPDILNHFVADSKPMPWFTLKYKTRWLSDGSVISGNPILTNILWNEVGRGVDLKKLEEWAQSPKAQEQIIELTSAVFGTTPPKYTDFFGTKSIDLEKAKRGEAVFNQSCFKCHGSYDKNWDQGFETTKVHYPEVTQVKNVGTDPNRWMAMKDLSKDLNRLAFSDTFNIKVVPQEGYVPPPLVGIWTRWPYFHNNSAPTLCDVLKAPESRRTSWYVGSPVDPETDYDQECNGFPELSKAPKAWRTKDRLFDTQKSGQTNTGHAKTVLGDEEISDVVMFLKTL